MVDFLQLYRMNGDAAEAAAEQTVFDELSGSHAMGLTANLQGYSAIRCEANNDQFSWGKKRLITRSTKKLKYMPIKYMVVHADDVTKDVQDMRFLPKEELLTACDHFVDGVDISIYRKRVAPLRVSS